MKAFPILPVLEVLKKDTDLNRNYNHVYIVAVQHLIETTGSLFESIIEIGIRPEHIFLLGKVYSTHYNTVKGLKSIGINVFDNQYPENFGTVRECLKKDISNLWNAVRENVNKNDTIIIIDDGGLAIKKAPKELFDDCSFYGIEQTTFGLRYQENIDHFPIIQVATSAAKKYLEPVLIARALTKKLNTLFKNSKSKSIGIIGIGNIGQAIAKQLLPDFKVYIYDKDVEKTKKIVGSIIVCSSIQEIMQCCDVIIGATGTDISDLNWDSMIKSDKMLVSVSSSDIEFNTLLKTYNYELLDKKYTLLDNLIITLQNGCKLSIIRGGTVANFDGSKESCPKDQIQLTRGLLFAGLLQALNNNIKIKGENGSIKLKADFQRIAVDQWIKLNLSFRSFYEVSLIENFKSNQWIEDHST